jgi:hypothetical protein
MYPFLNLRHTTIRRSQGEEMYALEVEKNSESSHISYLLIFPINL